MVLSNDREVSMTIDYIDWANVFFGIQLPVIDADYLYFMFVTGSNCLAFAFGMYYGKRILKFWVATFFNMIVGVIAVIFFTKFTLVGLIISNLVVQK